MRVLLVEDDSRLAETLQRGLSGEGYAVDVASDGEEALHQAVVGRYDVVLLDVMLPKLNGYQVCTALRAAGNWVPILMLTAKDGDYDQVDGLDVGADDYLTKPFSYLVLTARLRALVRRATTERPVELRVGDLVLDVAGRRCTRGGVPISLTTKEFSVLEFLMRNAGRVVGKQDILGRVWDLTFSGEVNIVEVYVSALRRKLDPPVGGSVIRTVRGVGYQIVRDG